MTEPSRCRADEHGISLIEMIIAMMVLSVALLAFAQVLMGSLRATREAQDTQVVTAASMEMIEKLVGLDWDEAAIYTNDVASADSRWSDRLDAGGTFDGLELVTIAGPASAAERDPEVPEPSWTVPRDGIDYTYDLYPVWVDRTGDPDGDGVEGDGIADTKRFVVIATWTDPVRGPQELRTTGERAPTQAEAGSNTSGGRFLIKYATPTLVTANATNGEIDKVAFAARTNVPLVGAVTATLRWNEPIVDASGTVTGYQAQTETVTLGPTTPAAGGGGWIEFAGEFNGRIGNASTNGKYRFANESVVVELTGTPASGGNDVKTSLVFTVEGSPYAPGDPTTGPAPSPSPTPSPDPAEDYGYTADPVVANISLPTLCVSENKWELQAPFVIEFYLKNVEPPSGTPGTATYRAPDAVVTVTYPYWSKKTGNAGDADLVGSISAEFYSGTQSGSTWRATIPANSGNLFKPGAEIDATVSLTRSSDDKGTSATSTHRQVGTC